MTTTEPERHDDTLDLVRDLAWRVYVRSAKDANHTPRAADRPVVEEVAAQVYEMAASLFLQRNGNGVADKCKPLVAVLALAGGVGLPAYDLAASGDMSTPALAGGAFLLGALLARMVPWGKKGEPR